MKKNLEIKDLGQSFLKVKYEEKKECFWIFSHLPEGQSLEMEKRWLFRCRWGCF